MLLPPAARARENLSLFNCRKRDGTRDGKGGEGGQLSMCTSETCSCLLKMRGEGEKDEWHSSIACTQETPFFKVKVDFYKSMF